MTDRSVVHDTFVIERTYPATAERVFEAWSNLDVKIQWFGGHDELESIEEHTLNFQVGGREQFSAKVPNGPVFRYDALYCDIVENERIVASYEMEMDGRRISVSLLTVLLTGVPGGTRLELTEQGAFLDGLDTNAQRAEGTAEILDKLGTLLAAA